MFIEEFRTIAKAMSTAESVNLRMTPSDPIATNGVRLHRFTVQEYHQMREAGVFEGENPIELLEGYLFVKMDYGPPYDVPLGIPSELIAGPDVPPYPQRRFTVREYHKLMESAALHPTLRTELVEGWVVEKMTRNAMHDATLQVAAEVLQRYIGADWRLRLQSAVVLGDARIET